MKKALVIGATGLIGKQLIYYLLEDPRYSKITLLLRRPMTINNKKLEQYMYDFDQPKSELVQCDDLFCCLGTTIKKAGSQERFYQIDHDYILDTARMALSNGANLVSLVSAMGANSQSKIFYNRVKGELEEHLQDLNAPSLHIVRPSLLLGDRQEKRFGEKMAQYLMTGLDWIIPAKYKAVEGKRVAEFMWQKANEDLAGYHVFNNDDIILSK